MRPEYYGALRGELGEVKLTCRYVSSRGYTVYYDF